MNSGRDVAAPQERRRAEVRLPQALRETRLEESEMLRRRSDALRKHGRLLGALVSGSWRS